MGRQIWKYRTLYIFGVIESLPGPPSSCHLYLDDFICMCIHPLSKVQHVFILIVVVEC